MLILVLLAACAAGPFASRAAAADLWVGGGAQLGGTGAVVVG